MDVLVVTGLPAAFRTYQVPPKSDEPLALRHARAGVTREGIQRPVVVGDLEIAAGTLDRPQQ